MNSMTKTILMSSMLLAVSATQCAEQQAQPTPAQVADALAALDARAPKAPVIELKPGFFSPLKPISRNVLLNSAAMTKKSRPVERSLEGLEQEEADLHCELYQTKITNKKKLSDLLTAQATQRGRTDIALHDLAQNPNFQNPTLLADAKKSLQERHEQELQELREVQEELEGTLGKHIQNTACAQKLLRQQKEQLDKEYQDSYAAICNNVKRQRRS